jgi:hypothetical protein
MTTSRSDRAAAERAVTERSVQSAIVDLLRWHGWMVRELSQPAAVRGDLVGVPDVVAFKAGVTVLVECKRSYCSVVRPSQRAFERELSPHQRFTLRYILTSDIDIFRGWLIEVERSAGVVTVEEQR